MAAFNARKDCTTSCFSVSYAAKVNMLIMTDHPDFIWIVFVAQIFTIQVMTKNLMSVRVCMLLSIICSKGFKKSFWKLKDMNSSLRKNLSASCRRLSIANIATIRFGWDPTQTKCLLSISHNFYQTKRMRTILRSAISTSAYKLNFLGFAWSFNSFLEFMHKLSIKLMIASWSRFRLFWKTWSIYSIWIDYTMISLFAAIVASFTDF